MVVSIPVDLINTREALNDIWSTDLTLVEYARKKDSLVRPRADPLYEQAFDLKFALLDVVVEAARDGALEVVAIDADGKRTKVPGITFAEYEAEDNITTARLYVDVPYLHNRKELTLCFERSKWRTWLASLAAPSLQPSPAMNQSSPPVRSPSRGRPARDQDKVREYIPEKYPNGSTPGPTEVHKAMKADGKPVSISTVGRAMGRRRDAYRGSKPRPKN